MIKVETPKNGGDPDRGYFYTDPVNLRSSWRTEASAASSSTCPPLVGGGLGRMVAEADVFVRSLLRGSGRARVNDWAAE